MDIVQADSIVRTQKMRVDGWFPFLDTSEMCPRKKGPSGLRSGHTFRLAQLAYISKCCSYAKITSSVNDDSYDLHKQKNISMSRQHRVGEGGNQAKVKHTDCTFLIRHRLTQEQLVRFG